ncbi:fused response regulator/phosphatase [Pseudoalteromonas ruthenica]|uniref:fused response regulator/phosphatase n=1 Tax=Pseudoalteromonas ruthenica TaxID=151081 RepID=UPI00241C904F|nr:fused response regulator/phosphatase [Pseudoalteromonas ruthenica]
MTEKYISFPSHGLSEDLPLVLIVDDESMNRRILRAMLERDHYRVIEAENGIQALAQCQAHDVDVVLLDILMPEMDGYETAAELKRTNTRVYTPIIFITALEDNPSLARCLDVGGDDFMPKPFDLQILRAKLHAHLRIRHLVSESKKQTDALTYYQNQTEREHELVEHIFNNALQHKDKPKGVDSHLSPASMFNGDVFLNALGPNGSQYYLLGDFTGHGLAAATGALPVARIFYTMVEKNLAVGDIARELNAALYDLLPAHMFCAATIFEISANAQSATFWMGGLPDGYLIDHSGYMLSQLESKHMALGILDDEEFERDVRHVTLNEYSRIVVYTDGIIEAENAQQHQFGYSGLLRTLASQAMIRTDNIIAAVHYFTGNEDQQDDYSVVIIDAQPQAPLQPINHTISPLPIELEVVLSAEELKTVDPVAQLMDLVGHLPGLNTHKSTLFILLSEAYNNALEHGILGLDSALKADDDGFLQYYSEREQRLSELTEGEICLRVCYQPQQRTLLLSVTDSGAGFSFEPSAGSQLQQSYGRGIELLKELAEDVEYNQAGNEIRIRYHID